MSGIYIHIPFCKQACHYCDFHFSTQLGKRETMVYDFISSKAVRVESRKVAKLLDQETFVLLDRDNMK